MTNDRGRHVLHIASEELTLRLFVCGLEEKLGRHGYTFSYAADDKSISQANLKSYMRLRIPRGLLLWMAWFTNRKFCKMIESRCIDAVHIHTPATALALYPHLRRLKGRPVRLFYTARGGYDEGVGGLRRILWVLADPLRWKIWDGVAVINSALARKALSFHPMRPTFRLSFGGAPLNISVNTDAKVAIKKRKSDSFTLAWVGRFARDKRVEDFIELVGILNRQSENRFTGFLVGGTTLFDRERPHTTNGAITELGWLECPQDVLKRVDLLVSTSVREGYGLSVVEAALVGTPSFAYRTNGTVESSKITLSRLVESGDIEGLAEAILRWVDYSSVEKVQIRKDVSRLSRNAYDDDGLAFELTAAYRELFRNTTNHSRIETRE